MAKDPESPATTSLAFDEMLPSWEKIRAVLNGTPAMRAAGEAYLPRHTMEEDNQYKERLNATTLYNQTAITLDGWVGRPFSEPIGLEDVPAVVDGLLEDVDLRGNNIHVFCRGWFKDGLAKAMSHVYVDYPRVDREQPRTLATDREEALRPYWVHILPDQLIFADAEVINGREILREIRIKEEVTVRDGFAEYCIPQIRRVYVNFTELGGVGHIELWQERKVKGKKKVEWVIVDEYDYDLDVIPFVTFYSDRCGFMRGKPPLEDLVELNITHWQSTSDQRACLTVARFPILFQTGGTDDDGPTTIGPRRMLFDSNPATRFGYVEHTGAALKVGQDDLDKLEMQMAGYGAEFLKKRPGDETATARALDSAEASSPLQDVTRRFADALTQALAMTALWMKQETGGVATLVTDFGPEEVSDAELNTLKETRKSRDLSLQTYLEELQRRGLLPEELDIEEEMGRIEQEQLKMLPAGPLEEEPVV